MVRSSFKACPRLREESQDTMAITKNPRIAGIFGTLLIDKAITETIIPLIELKIKLDHGTSNMLAIIIGIAKPNKLRPPATCSGVSLNAKTMVKKTRKIIAAIRPEKRVLIE